MGINAGEARQRFNILTSPNLLFRRGTKWKPLVYSVFGLQRVWRGSARLLEATLASSVEVYEAQPSSRSEATAADQCALRATPEYWPLLRR